MSVTFGIGGDIDVTGYAVSCYAYGADREFLGPVCPTREEALTAHTHDHGAERPEYCDGEYARPVTRFEDADVNLSNTNALAVLDALGLEHDFHTGLCGSIAAEDFLGRVLLALALEPADTGMPAHQMTAAEISTDPLLGALGAPASEYTGPTIITGGRPAGYMQERLTQLHAVASLAIQHDRPVCWG